MFGHHVFMVVTIIVILFFIRNEAGCPWYVTFEDVRHDFYQNMYSVCQTEEDFEDYVRRLADYVCCSFGMRSCTIAKGLSEYLSTSNDFNKLCGHGFFSALFSFCDCAARFGINRISHYGHTDQNIMGSQMTPPIIYRRPQRPEIFERPQRPERPERPEIVERPERPVIFERPQRPERSGKHPEEGKRDLSCGFNGPSQSRIVGGEKSTACEFPWIVRFIAGEYQCGGAIVDNVHILTAAHCVILAKDNRMYITVNTIDVMAGETFEIQNTSMHPSYKVINQGYYNDIAVLKLAKELVFSDCIQPICLPRGEHATIDNPNNCFTAGWGKNARGNMQRFLHKVRVPILDDKICQKYVRGYRKGLLCAGYLEGGKDACSGDSGGPLMCETKGQWVLKGVVSFGYKCARAYHPGVYTDITRYMKWISKNIE